MINEKYKNELSNIKSVSNMREQFKEFCTSVRTRLSTGYLNLDFLLGGGLTDELYVFGAPTSSGKTAFLMSIAQNLAKAGVYVLYFTFVHGIGRRKSAIQKSIESLEIYIGKLKKYIHKLYACGERKIIFLLRLTGRQHSSNGNTVKHGWILLLFVSLYITKRSEDVLQWGKRKNIKKFMINGELVIEWKKEKSIKDVVVENICYD